MKKVQVKHETISLETISNDKLNPHPTFPQWATWSIYPYQTHGIMKRLAYRGNYYMPTIENEYLRVTVAADIGGRIWDVYDKIGKRHVVNFNNHVHTYNGGFGLNYTSAGIECNYPFAHACTTSYPREITTRTNPDGSASIICGEYERIWRTRWSVAYTLYPGRSFVELKVRIYNRTPHDSRYMYWNNCGFYLTPNTRFIFPEDRGAMHGQDKNITMSWPKWQKHDLSLFKEIPPEMLGLYMLDSTEPFFGYYNHDEGYGLVHYADLADLPGKKSWTWGTHPAYCDHLRKVHHGLNQVYGEVQSGRIVIQEHLDRVPPETESQWSEIWYPVRGTGGFNGKQSGGAMNAELLEVSPKRSVIKISAMANGEFPEASLLLLAEGVRPIERSFPVNPRTIKEKTIVVTSRIAPENNGKIVLRDKTGRILATCRLKPPTTRDSWREITEIPARVEAVGAEQLFFNAEKQARDVKNRLDLKPFYEKPLTVDSGFTPAHRELGKLAIWQGRYQEAIDHFEKALKRDEDSVSLNYYKGVALMSAGRLTEARKALELANRYDGKARSLVRLAELRMREGDFHHAAAYLNRLRTAYPTLTRPRGLLAVCLRKLGCIKEASEEILDAMTIDGQDPFLQIESIFLSGDKTRKTKLLEQVRGHEEPLLEAAYDYMAVGLFEEDVSVTRMIPKPGPLTLLTQAYALGQSGRKQAALKTLKRACSLDVVGHQIWRLEMFDILAWAKNQMPKEPRLVFLHGNLCMARRLTGEGAAFWRKAVEMGERHWLLFANLGYYYAKVLNDSPTALDWFYKAEKAYSDDPYVKHEIGSILLADTPGKAIRYLEENKDTVLSSPPLTGLLLSAYLKLNDYAKFDRVCKQVDFRHNWQLYGPTTLWYTRHFQQALQWINNGKYQETLDLLSGLKPTPANAGHHYPLDMEEDRRYYHIGRCYEGLGLIDEARKCWEKALAVQHYTGYEHVYWYNQWKQRYYQALSLQKLGRRSEAEAYWDAMELVAQSGEPRLALEARKSLLDMVERGRFGADEEKDPVQAKEVIVKTSAEE